MSADITPFIADAQRLQNETGIPASITLGQIILESSGKYAGGLSGLAAQAKNLFGIKGTGTAGSIQMPTSEFINGNYHSVMANFRSYNSFYDSMLDHAKVLSSSRYSQYLSNAKSINDYAAGIKAGGYATDPSYANKLIGIISKQNLHQYDTGNYSFKPIVDTQAAANSSTPSSGGLLDSIFFNVVRTIFVLTVFILMIVFFLKAFPAVDDTVSMVAPTPTKPLKMLKAIKGATK